MDKRIVAVRLPFLLPVSEERSVDRFVYAYLVLGDDLCIIDTGAAGYQQGIVDALQDVGRQPADVDWVVNTHAHPDHIGGNAFFQRTASPRFACHADAVRWIENLDLQYKERPIYAFYTIAGSEGVKITDRLEDGDVIDLGSGVTLEVIATPGHSPGSMALFCRHEGTLITADTLPPTGGLPLYGDVDKLRNSLRRLMALPDVEKMYASHTDAPYEGDQVGAALQAGLDYLDRMDEAVAGVVHRMGPDAPPEEITREVLLKMGFETPPVLPIVITSVMSHVS